MSAPTSVSIVVPCYNSEQSLALLYDRLATVFQRDGRGFELLLVDDGSRDGTWGVIATLAAAHANVRGFRMLRNYGQHNALLCGIRAAKHRYIVTMDDDLQNPPEEVPALIAELEKGFDVVYGTPKKQSHGLFRDLASSITKLVLQNAMGAEAARNLSAFRAFRAEIRQAFAAYRGPYVSIDVLLTWGARKFSAVPVHNDTRQFGASNYTFGKLVSHAINIMTGFSTLPLQLASYAGFISTVFGIAVLGWVLSGYFIHGRSVPGFTFLASVVSILGGVQLFALGIFGEYLARIHIRSMDRPSYSVGEETCARDN